jgi:hypothetical protein
MCVYEGTGRRNLNALIQQEAIIMPLSGGKTIR